MKSNVKFPRRNPKGLWADLNVDITEEDIEKARKEMWGQVSERGYRMNGMMLDTHAAVWFPLESHPIGRPGVNLDHLRGRGGLPG